MKHLLSLLLLTAFLVLTHHAQGYDLYKVNENSSSRARMQALRKIQEQANEKPRYSVGDTYMPQNSTLIEDAGFTRQSSIDAALEDVRRREAERHPERFQSASTPSLAKYRESEEERLKQEAAREGVNNFLHRNYWEEKKKEEARQREESRKDWPIVLRNMGILFLIIVGIYILGMWDETKQTFRQTYKRITNISKQLITAHNLAVTSACLMLLLALADMPYWYYTLLRVAICAYSISGILMSPTPVHRMLYIGLALLYNPVSPVHLDRSVWAPINLATAALITTLHLLRPRLPEKQ